MPDYLISIFVSVTSGLVTSVIVTMFYMWKDQAVMKRDIDALAEHIGTERAKCRVRRQKERDFL